MAMASESDFSVIKTIDESNLTDKNDLKSYNLYDSVSSKIRNFEPLTAEDKEECLREAKMTKEELEKYEKAKKKKLRAKYREMQFLELKQEIALNSQKHMQELERIKQQSNSLSTPGLQSANFLSLTNTDSSTDMKEENHTYASIASGNYARKESNSSMQFASEIIRESPLSSFDEGFSSMKNQQDLISIKVLGCGTKPIELNILPSTTILRVKELLMKETKVLPSKQSLSLDGRDLDNALKASQCAMVDGSSIVYTASL